MLIAADRVRVLGDAPAPPPSPSLRTTIPSTLTCVAPWSPSTSTTDSFVVHVNDHTRTIFIGNDTDLIQGDTQENFPLQPGDRVTVSGVLHADGTVVADTVILGRSPDAAGRDGSGPQELLGRIIGEGSRDITIRVASSDREVKSPCSPATFPSPVTAIRFPWMI